MNNNKSPTGLTQHPAYRAGVEAAALELAHRANKRDMEARRLSGRVAEDRRGWADELRSARMDVQCLLGTSEPCELLDTKEVRDGE